MPTTLTGSKVRDTYSQLLHVDGGVAATEKSVLTGAGAATALKVGTSSASVGNVRLAGSTIAPIDPLTPLTISTPTITGGSITGITDLAVADGGTGASTPAAARTNLELGTIATQNADNVAITGGAVAFSALSGRAFAMFSDITDQTGSVSTPTAVKFGTTEIVGAGITIASSGGNATRITFVTAGTYMIAPNLQFINSDTNDHDVYVWFRRNGTDIARSATRITVPKTGDGGAAFFQIIGYDTVTANQYIEVIWLPENIAVTIDHTAAAAGPPAIPAIPSAIVIAERIA